MRHPMKNWTLGSTVLLSLALLSHLAALGEASLTHPGGASTIDDLKSNSLFWKRDRLPLYPRHTPSSSSNQQFQTEGSGYLRKRSLFSHVNDDIVVSPSPPARLPAVHRRRPHLIEEEEEEEEDQFDNVVRMTVEVTHERGRERGVAVETHSNNHNNNNNNKFDHTTTTNKHNSKDDKVSETTDKLNFWTDDNEDEEEERTFIEPHYPSIDLFDEEELLEVGEDGILREKGHHRSSHSSVDGDEDDRREQGGWLVDEWEEELEGDMDEWMDWVEEDHALNRIDAEKDKHRLRDQSAMDSLVLDEDEASPFQRLFSESWLF